MILRIKINRKFSALAATISASPVRQYHVFINKTFERHWEVKRIADNKNALELIKSKKSIWVLALQLAAAADKNCGTRISHKFNRSRNWMIISIPLSIYLLQTIILSGFTRNCLTHRVPRAILHKTVLPTVQLLASIELAHGCLERGQKALLTF